MGAGQTAKGGAAAVINLDRIDPSQVEDRAALAIELEMECLRDDGDWSRYFECKADYCPSVGRYPGED